MHSEVKIENAKTAFSLAAFCIVIVGASVDIFVPSLPHIAIDLHAPSHLVSLLVTVYLLSYGVFQLAAGPFADSFGRRRIMIIALFGYMIASGLIPLTHSIYVLMLLRVFQGIFAAGIGVVVRAIVADCFSGKMLEKHLSYLALFWAIGPIFSPYLGGYLQHHFGWHAAFYFLAAYTFITSLLVICLLPETAAVRHSFQVKVIIKNYRHVFLHPAFIGGTVICGLTYGLITMYNVIGPFLVQSALKYSPIVYGHIALFLGIAWLAGNVICRTIIVKPAASTYILFSLIAGIFIALLLLGLAVFGPFNLWTTVTPPLLLFVCGGIIYVYCFSRCLAQFPDIAGTASAAMGCIFSMIAGVVSGIAGSLRAETLLPLALSYLAALSIALICYLCVRESLSQRLTYR